MSSGQHHLFTLRIPSFAKSLGQTTIVSPQPFSSSGFNSKCQLHAVFSRRSFLPWLKDWIFSCRSFAERNDGECWRVCTFKLCSHEVSSRRCQVLCAKKFGADRERIFRKFFFCSSSASKSQSFRNKLAQISRLVGQLWAGMLAASTKTVCRLFFSSIKIVELGYCWCSSCLDNCARSNDYPSHHSQRLLTNYWAFKIFPVSDIICVSTMHTSSQMRASMVFALKTWLCPTCHFLKSVSIAFKLQNKKKKAVPLQNHAFKTTHFSAVFECGIPRSSLVARYVLVAVSLNTDHLDSSSVTILMQHSHCTHTDPE